MIPSRSACYATVLLLAGLHATALDGQEVEWRIELAHDVTVRLEVVAGAMAQWQPLSPEAPVELPVGEPVTFEFTSHGSSSCTRPGTASITQQDSVVTVVVLDSLRTGPCTMDYRAFPRVASHTFPQAGEYRMRVVGRVHDQIFRVRVGQ